MELDEGVGENEAKCKAEKPGIVYLSRIPRRMNVKQIRHVFGSFGEVGRVFLKPIGKEFGTGILLELDFLVVSPIA